MVVLIFLIVHLIKIEKKPKSTEKSPSIIDDNSCASSAILPS